MDDDYMPLEVIDYYQNLIDSGIISLPMENQHNNYEDEFTKLSTISKNGGTEYMKFYRNKFYDKEIEMFTGFEFYLQTPYTLNWHKGIGGSCRLVFLYPTEERMKWYLINSQTVPIRLHLFRRNIFDNSRDIITFFSCLQDWLENENSAVN